MENKEEEDTAILSDAHSHLWIGGERREEREKNKFPQQTTDQQDSSICNNKSDGNPSKIQRTRLPKLHSLGLPTKNCEQLKVHVV